MKEISIEDEHFKDINYTEKHLPKGKYDNCIFLNCDFTQSNISNLTFVECKFENCDFSLVISKNTAFRDVQFINCKLLGFNFNDCTESFLDFHFDNYQLNLASFFQLKIKDTIFKNCTLQEVDFSETDLTESSFDDCDLSRAIFDNSILEKVDFRTAFNYSIDPDGNRIRGAKFSMSGVIGLLRKYKIEVE